MKLIARSKPIRIRIMSGGEEHFSLDSLRHNFCVQDVFPLIEDKRLVRWLKQQNQEELAKSVDACEFNGQLDDVVCFKVLELFLEQDVQEANATDIYSLYAYWLSKNSQNKKCLNALRNYLLTTEKGFIFLVKECNDKLLDMPASEKYSKLERLEPKEDAQLLFMQGKMLYEGYEKNGERVRDTQKGKELIEKSKQMDYPDAISFDLTAVAAGFCSKREEVISSIDFDSKKKIDEQILKWNNAELDYKNRILDTDSEIVKQVKTLLMEFRDFRKAYDVDPASFWLTIKKEYHHLDENNVFYKERRFLYELAREETIGMGDFEELANAYHYPLAKYMLECKENPYEPLKIDGINYRALPIFVPYYEYALKVNGDKLSFIVDHLFKY